MGICFPLAKIDRQKYEENEDIPTHRIDSIVLKSEEFITSLSVCCQDKWVLAQEETVSVYSDFSYISSWTANERIRALCSDENYVALGGKTIEIFTHAGKSQSRLIGHERPATSVCINNNFLLSGSSDWTVRLWDIFSQQELQKILINWNVVTSLSWKENLAVQTSEDLRLRLWDIRDRKIMKSAVINVGDNFATCCDIRDNTILTGHRGFNSNGCDVKVWDLRKKELVSTLKAHSQSVECVRIIDDKLFSCGKDGRIVEFKHDASIVDEWVHESEKPFIVIENYKGGVIAANVEPKVMFFNVSPLKNEF